MLLFYQFFFLRNIECEASTALIKSRSNIVTDALVEFERRKEKLNADGKWKVEDDVEHKILKLLSIHLERVPTAEQVWVKSTAKECVSWEGWRDRLNFTIP